MICKRVDILVFERIVQDRSCETILFYKNFLISYCILFFDGFGCVWFGFMAH